MQITLKRGNCNFDRALQDKWGSAETATGVRNFGYRRTMGMGTTYYGNFFYEIYRKWPAVCEQLNALPQKSFR